MDLNEYREYNKEKSDRLKKYLKSNYGVKNLSKFTHEEIEDDRYSYRVYSLKFEDDWFIVYYYRDYDEWEFQNVKQDFSKAITGCNQIDFMKKLNSLEHYKKSEIIDHEIFMGSIYLLFKEYVIYEEKKFEVFTIVYDANINKKELLNVKEV